MDELLISDSGRVRTLTMNRPESLNALSLSLQDVLREALLDAAADSSVSAIVLTASGDRSFCSGVDLKEVSTLGPDWPGPYGIGTRSVWEVLVETYKPTIAAVNGLAVGGGFELLLACDLVVAAAGVRVGLPEAKIGLGASFASAQLSRRVPHGVASDLLFTGSLRPVETLVPWGLIHRVVDPDQVQTAAAALAEQIAANAPLSLRRMKETMVKGQTLPLMTAVTLGAGPDPYQSADRGEGVAAFLARRPPQWTGR